MGNYKIEVKPSVQSEIVDLPDNVLRRVVSRIESLAQQPRPRGCKKLAGYRSYWRIRVGDWRVVYMDDDARRLVSIVRVAHRREVYE